MALYNRVKVAITAGGAGNLTVGAAVAMFRDFSGAAVPTGTVVSYVIEDEASNAWEYGRGTYTAPNTFARTTVLATSAGTTTPITAGAAAILFIDALAEDFVSALAVGTTPITGGTSGRVVFNNGGNFGEAANLTYDGVDTTVRGLKLNGATSGTVSIKPQAVAGAWTLTLPTTAGTAGQILSTDGAGLTTWTTLIGVTDGDKGDITVSATGATWTIDANSVTYAKMQTVAGAQRVLGSATAAGAVSELSASAVLDWLGTAAQGQIAFRGATGWTLLAPGTAGQVLTTQGAAANVAWTTPAQPLNVTQIKMQLVANGTMQTVFDSIPADVTNTVNVRWVSGGTFKANDPLYNHIKTTLAFTDAQMTTLMTNAQGQQA
jgi:hypothetical protein